MALGENRGHSRRAEAWSPVVTHPYKMGVPGMTIRVLGMGAGDDAGAASTDAGATSTLEASAYGGPPFEPTIFTNFLVLCCTPVMQVFLINLILGLVAFAVRSMQWVVFGRLRAAEWQVPSATWRCPHSLALPSLASRRGRGTG